MSLSPSGKVPVYDSYGRLSRVPETGELEKIDTQHADNHKTIERHGARVGLDLDDGLSAWKEGVRRKDWEKLLQRVRDRVVDGCCVWHLDRLFRRPRDLETLIDLADKGFKIISAHGTRDLSDPDDRFILRIEVAHAARSSDDTSRRIKRRFATFRESGRTTGGARRFGFGGLDVVARGPEGERVPVPDSLVAAERAALVQAATDMLAGTTAAAIAARWNKAGLCHVTGKAWIPTTVKATMRRPALGGYVAHGGEMVGRLEGEPILDERTFDRLQALFASRRRGRPTGSAANGRKYLATGLLWCVCGVKLAAHSQPPKTYPDGTVRAVYYCSKDRRGCGKVYADMLAVDLHVRALVIGRLSDPEYAEAIESARLEVSDKLAAVEKELKDCYEIEEALSAKLGARAMRVKAWAAAMEPLRRSIDDLEARKAKLRGGAPEGEPIKPESVEVLGARWDDGDHDQQRGMMARALGARRVVIKPYTGMGKRVFDHRRIDVVDPQDPNEPDAGPAPRVSLESLPVSMPDAFAGDSGTQAAA
jgi:DNA invertase Pin-like site-specific DNA recombinase